MKKNLTHKQIILGVTGGIAAYKSADLVRRLREAGAEVRVVMTRHAKEFITPLTMQAVSGYPVHDDLFDLKAEAAMGHIELARWADVIVMAPATADLMAKLAGGEADDLLTTLCLATRAPIVLAPAMNQGMWKNTSTQNNAQVLMQKGIHLWGPAEGDQACGEVGPGRMLEPLEIVDRLEKLFSNNLLSGKKILLTAGPTQEFIDPVRYISNASSGKMGYALAEAAQEAGAAVTLISGPVHLNKPDRVRIVNVVTAEEMLNAVMHNIQDCDLFISVAAVADYRCKNPSAHKLKKSTETLTLELEKNPDIVTAVASLSKRPFVVGFAAETDDLVNKAREKLKNKNLDMIIANHADVIGSDESTVIVLDKEKQHEYPPLSKPKLAKELIQLISSQLQK